MGNSFRVRGPPIRPLSCTLYCMLIASGAGGEQEVFRSIQDYAKEDEHRLERKVTWGKQLITENWGVLPS